MRARERAGRVVCAIRGRVRNVDDKQGVEGSEVPAKPACCNA